MCLLLKIKKVQNWSSVGRDTSIHRVIWTVESVFFCFFVLFGSIPRRLRAERRGFGETLTLQTVATFHIAIILQPTYRADGSPRIQVEGLEHILKATILHCSQQMFPIFRISSTMGWWQISIPTGPELMVPLVSSEPQSSCDPFKNDFCDEKG